jgi:branched-chain amino acid transport system permease protein
MRMSESILIFMGINIILALSFYLTTSTGQISLGHGAFMAIGAYTSSYLTATIGWGLAEAFIAAIIVSGIIGFLIGFPALRIKGIYLAVGTLGFGELVNVLFRNMEIVGGAKGFSGMMGTTLPLVLSLAIIVLLFVIHLDRARLGWSFRAVHQDETAAQLLGINIVYVKICAFTLSAALTGLGGALYAHYMFFIEPGNFGFHASLIILFYVLFGGIQNPWGGVVGAIILTLLPELFRFFDDWRMVIYGVIIILMMILRPQGLITDSLISKISGLLRRLKPSQFVRISRR